MNRVHDVYGGGEVEIGSSELVPGEISEDGTLSKWRKAGVVIACVSHTGYAYDPEIMIFEGGVGDPPTTHCVWRGSTKSGHWTLLHVKRQFTHE